MIKRTIALIAILATIAYANTTIKTVNRINNEPTNTWTATIYPQFEDMSRVEKEQMMGFKKDQQLRDSVHIDDYILVGDVNAFPASFDARKQWGACVHPVRDQGQCGSCWAFGCTESLSDRFCISTNKTIDHVLSVEELVSCNLWGLEGCSGGDPVTAWIYVSEYGLPTDSCFPYTAGSGVQPSCASKCVNKEPWKLYYGSVTSLRYHISVEGIMDTIYHHGPTEACFSVYDDFMQYKSGVYEHKTGSFLGGHCIKLVGWGVTDEGVEYWIAQNSWGTSWGEHGFFQIKKGVDMCGIEGEVFSGLPSY
eukprot:TRINITY_DN3673_c0_g1_i1.p1 TRINITY_DN3673_c0_g1~~TRINITY_DN3673_c0_g1_i1.p1  ORF type:complete len:308 (+),score=58.16 TRINITY_DN3673_c0_g1_i1:30-953(+)